MSDAPEWPVIESETEYETGWYEGGYDLVEQPDGSEKRYYWADLPPAVVIVARIDGDAAARVEVADGRTADGPEAGVDGLAAETDERVADATGGPAGATDATGTEDDGRDRLLFVEQYRPTIRETHLELPAGIVEDGESYTEAAARELEEETGFRPSSATLLQEYAVATGVLRHDRAVVYAEGLEPGERALDTNEFLTVRTVPVDEALSLAREPPANDSTISALLLARADGLL